MKQDPLSKAAGLIRSARYDEAIKLLEAEDNRLFDSFRCNYLLGLANLYAGVYGNALSYFKKAREQKMRDAPVMLGMAALYLNHGDTDKAVDIYLEIQDMDERNLLARRALKVIRKYPGPEGIARWIETGKLRTLFPPLPRRKLSPAAFLIPLAALALLFGAGLLAQKNGLLSIPFLRDLAGPSRTSAGELTLTGEEKDAPMQTGGVYRYVLTKNEALKLYEEARVLFTAYHDEAAKVKLNKILESNAPEGIKNRARMIFSYTDVPGFDTLKDRFSYAEVMREPMLYRDCYVIWRGMATNLEQGQHDTAFDFLVGYDTRKVLEGIVRTSFDFAIPVNTERPLEVLGKIVPVSSEKGIEITLEGTALNQAGLLDGQDGQR